MATAPQRTASAWDAFYADWVVPVLRFGTPALVVFVVLLIVVRVLSRAVVGTDDQSLSRRWDWSYSLAILGLVVAAIDASVTLPLSFDATYDRAVQAMLWITVALLVACGLLLAALFARPARTRDLAVYCGAVFLAFILVGIAAYFPNQWHQPVAVVVWGVLLAIAAAVSAARLRGLHIGLVIAGRNKHGADDAGLGEYVRARLHALGSQPPRGIDLTQATDVSALPDGALNLLPAGTLAKLGALLVQLVQPATPWRVIVCEQVDGSVSVVLVRNGKVADTVIIRRQLLGLPDALKDPAGANLALRTAAAAFVLLNLAKRHPRLCRGLGGATDWRSVATQVIATDPSVTSADVKIALLTNAVAFDGRNLAARAALITLGYRSQGTEQDYERRLEELQREAERRRDDADDLIPIRLRTLFNLTIIRINTAVSDTTGRAGALRDADETATELVHLLDEADRRPELGQLAGDIRSAAWFLRASITALAGEVRPAGGAEPTTHMSQLAYYEKACLHMLRAEVDSALDALFIALGDPRMRTNARTDPSFRRLHDQDLESLTRVERFKHLIGDPAPEELFDLVPVKRRRKRLERNGIRTAEQLRVTPLSRLVDEVGIRAGEARALQELAVLNHVVNDATLVFLLLQLDIDTRAELRRQLAPENEFRAKLIDAARDYTVVVPTAATVRAWRTDH